MEVESAQLPFVTKDKLAALSVQIADVESAKAENEQRRDMIIRAPTDGVVSGLLAHAGQPVVSNTPIMSVLPGNASLVAELWVPSQSIGLLRVGESVEVSYEAFPAKQYGFHHGTIESISTSALSASDLAKVLGSEQKTEGYRVVVRLANEAMRETRFPLKPSMALSAKVDVETRSLIRWLIKPPKKSASASGEEESSRG